MPWHRFRKASAWGLDVRVCRVLDGHYSASNIAGLYGELRCYIAIEEVTSFTSLQGIAPARRIGNTLSLACFLRILSRCQRDSSNALAIERYDGVWRLFKETLVRDIKISLCVDTIRRELEDKQKEG